MSKRDSSSDLRPEPDEPTSTRTADGFFIAGIGASAGGLEAMQKMLPHLPAGIGLAYVVVQHLASKYTSMLGELLAKCTKMPVEYVQDNTRVKPDTIYITPADKDIVLDKNCLHLRETEHAAPKPSIDYFFQSLAEEKGPLAIGVVLSGSGTDGAHGIRAIKAGNGITITQATESAKFPGMPEAANQTGCVDLRLPPEEIGPTLAALVAAPNHQVKEDGWETHREELQAILTLLSEKGQTDFSQYRPTTIFRRISRRAMLNQFGSLKEYLVFLQKTPTELDLLQKDLLISVTKFFRDKEAFAALSGILAEKLEHKQPIDPLRVWVPACSTGEEAYSIAMLLSELFEAIGSRLRIQIFATDIDEDSIQYARKGLYPLAAVMDEPKELVDRYFTRVDNMVAINRELRDVVLFARQDLLKDTPFLHLDLISCRNLLIYLESDLQKKILSLFHFSLKQDGLLFLGKSESVSRRPELFHSVNGKWKIFKRKESLSNTMPALLQRRRHLQVTPVPIATQRLEKTELWKEREFATSLLNLLECSAILTDEQGNIVYIRGDVSQYLRLPEGSVRESLNAVHMARKEFRFMLESLLCRARKERKPVISQEVRFEKAGNIHVVRLLVGQVESSSEPQFLLAFQQVANFPCATESSRGAATDDDNRGRIAELELELAVTRDQQQEMVEELETNSEELQSLNEELQASNEELQASNEELGTTNEELQASNEELYTVNEELRAKSLELVQTMAQLGESEKRYKQLVQNANSAIIRWQADGAITFFNEYAERFFGYKAEEILGKHVGILVPQQDSLGQNMQALVQDIVARPASYENNVNENICRNGRRVWMTWSNRAILDENGHVTEILAVGSDITALKNTEEQLRKSAKDLRESQKIAKLGSWRLEFKTNAVQWTEELYNTYGFDPSLPPPPYSQHHKLFTEDSWRQLSEAVQRAAEQAIPYELELQTVRQDGTNGWMWARGEPERDESGSIVGLWGAAQDISERKELEFETKTLAKQRQLALDAAHLGWWKYNPLTRIAAWDSGYKAIFGVSEDTKPNDEILEKIIHPDDLAELWEKVTLALDPSTAGRFHAEYRIIRPDGELRWIEAHGIASFAGAGEARHAVELVGTVADITRRKNFELLLKASEERLSAFIANAPVALAMLDREMCYVSYSNRWLKDYSLPERDIVGLSHYDVFPEIPERLRDYHRRALSGEVLTGRGDRFKRADGTVQWLDWEVRPWHDKDGKIGGILIFSEDVTELKASEQDRERLLSQLNQAQKMEAIGRLAGGVAHDYNNMLNVIIGYTELALDKVAEASPLHDDLVEIDKAARRSAAITQQLLAFARKQTIIPRKIDLNRAVSGTLKMLQRLIGENIKLTWSPGSGLWPVKMDPVQIDQILANLCVNARAAIGDFGNIVIETRNISAGDSMLPQQDDLPAGDVVQLTVTDDGCGMDAATVEKIFEPFFTTKEVGQGTGLGLATVYGIIKQNHGCISVTSAEERGTSFKIFLPRWGEDDHEQPRPAPHVPSASELRTVLLVEDEPAILRVTKTMLERCGYKVLTASHALEAIRQTDSYQGDIDILITDVVMPDMSGKKLAETLVLSRPKLKILFVSGYTADHIAQHGVLEAGTNFLEKPYTRNQLMNKLQEIFTSEPDGDWPGD